MKRILLIVTLSLASCVSMQQLDDSLNLLLDQKKTVAFAALGYPSSTQQFDDITVYIWQINSQGIIIIPTTTTSFATINSQIYHGYSFENTPIPVTYSCQIKMGVDKNNIINHYEYSGDINGCQLYIERLHRYFSH